MEDAPAHTLYEKCIFIFCILVVACAVVQYLTRSKTEISTTAAFKKFQRMWLVVYLLAMAGDWLQGPFVYALYDSYGFSKEEIAHLFIAGFGSSMIFGTFVGSLADKYGRKKLSVAYGIIYGLSCCTKLYNDYYVLMLGRILSGVATSLLFSSFESWMTSEHLNRQFSPAWLSQTFSYATFGNSMVAIGSGLVANSVADSYGYVAPFMTALVVLVVCSAVVASQWGENYGDQTISLGGGWHNAIKGLQSDTRVPLLGLVQSLFEASMYSFVFLWSPSLEEFTAEALPFGVIFACFMVAMMVGSGVFTFLIRRHKAEDIALGNLLAAAACLAVPVFSSNTIVTFCGFLAFEFCCGIYFPVQGTLRGKIVPEDTRAATMNLFRVPLNLLVVLVLVKVSAFENSTVFKIIVSWLLLAAFLQFQIIKRTTHVELAVKQGDSA